MPIEARYRFAFLGIAAVVIACAFFFGKCSREDESYKMAGVDPGDIVVNAHRYNPAVDGPRGKAARPKTGSATTQEGP